MKKVILTITFILFLVACDVPETYVYLGKQVPKKYIKEIKSLGLIEKDEKLIYFYSDGLTDIKDGLFFVTDQNLVLYSNQWEEPKTIIPFGNISFLNIEYNKSFLEDSYVYVVTKDSLEVEFPISSERNRDEDFYNYILKKSNLQ